jgi:hypothetical protein
MRRPTLSGWFAAICVLGSAVWACSSDDTNPFEEGTRGGAGGTSGTDTTGGGSSGSSAGGATGGSPSGGTGGSSTGGDPTGGTTSGSTGDGGAAAESGADSGGTTTGGSGGTPGGAGNGAGAGAGGTPAVGGAGMGGMLGGAGAGGAGTGGAGTGGAGTGGAGTGGSGGAPGGCRADGDCKSTQYCKKATCDAESGECAARGPECRGATAKFEPVCGCDGITYWNTCVIEHEGFNVALHGECTGNARPTCTRDGGGDSCPERTRARCYRPVDVCGDTSPTTGVCWALPSECPNEDQTQRYCGGTAGSARCIGLCEVIAAENSFQRDADRCAN